MTQEEQALESWKPDQTLFDAGTAAQYGKQRQDIEEGVGGYSGITNPVLAARMKEIALQEAADQESSARADAARGYNQQELQNKQFLATLRKPQYIQTGATTTSTGSGNSVTVAPQQSLLSTIIGGGLGLASAFA
jgi:regulator of protease activity HflC (stomatin/prohibitin superfamily)